MKEKDLPQVLDIEAESFPEPWPVHFFLEEFQRSISFLRVLVLGEAEETVVGYFCFWRVAGEMHLLNFAVHPSFRRKGFGGRLMEDLLKEAETSGCRTILLEVRVSNEAAFAFYQKWGFAPYGRRPRYYRRPIPEDALLLARDLPKEPH